MTSRSLAAWLLVAAVATGCDFDPFAGGTTLVEYDLVSIAGDPLPAAYVVNGSVVQVELVSSRLRLRTDHRGEESVTQRQPAGGQLSEYRSDFSWEINGSEIRFTYDCPDLASCIAGPHLAGTVGPQGMTLTSVLGRSPLSYRRR